MRSTITEVAVLMYHALEDDSHPAGAKDSGEQLYVLSAATFREQLQYLHREGYKTVLLQDLFATKNFPAKSVIITFDDGHVSNFAVALPLLQQFGFVADFFITTGWLDKTYSLSKKQVGLLSKAGMGIGSHGVSHSFLSDLSEYQIVRELTESKLTLEDIIGKSVVSFSAPGGRLSEQVVSIAKSIGYHSFCSSEIGTLKKRQHAGVVPRIVLKNTLELNDFSKIVNCAKSYYRIHKSKYILLQFIKKVLGNTLYVKLHSCISKL